MKLKELTEFRSIVQQLAWLARATMPSIAYDVSDLQQRTPEATVADMMRANSVVRDAQKKAQEDVCLSFGKLDSRWRWLQYMMPDLEIHLEADLRVGAL